MKERANEFLRAVGRADAYTIATGRLREPDVSALKQAVRALVSDSWIARNAESAEVVAFEAIGVTTHPESADRAISDLLRGRFPDETVRPALNSRWG